jgi:hypothetical protein
MIKIVIESEKIDWKELLKRIMLGAAIIIQTGLNRLLGEFGILGFGFL